jgi:hypothetical protein
MSRAGTTAGAHVQNSLAAPPARSLWGAVGSEDVATVAFSAACATISVFHL